jgi:NAD-dependent dihydropyrimidine dehydrogenase PreA subunit
MKRKIINIDQEKCSGCGMCVPDCPEGALQIIDGKARLVGDLLCDGLGACITSCPEDAISVEEREAEPYDEVRVLENIIPQGRNVLQAHLRHLRDHSQAEYYQQALSYLHKHKIAVDLPPEHANPQPATKQCPGSQTLAFRSPQNGTGDGQSRHSQLSHWPIQLHLISPSAPHFRNSDLLIAADCVAFSHGDFHRNFLKSHTLAIACPKLDTNQEIYLDKLTSLIDEAQLKSIRVIIMQVPCCRGLLQLVVEAAGRAKQSVPVSCVTVGIQGQILGEDPVEIGQIEAFSA